MECCIQHNRIERVDKKPLFKGAMFLGVLGFWLMVFGLGNYSLHVPFGHPAGVINKHGVCYLASAVQMLDAVKFSLGDQHEAIFQSQGGLLAAYRDIHVAGTDFCGVPSCIDPDVLVKKWVECNSAKYKGPYIIKQVRQHDGSLVKEELFPEKVNGGIGGDVRVVFEGMFNELNASAQEQGVTNPFSIMLQTARRAGAKNTVSRLTYIPRNQQSTSGADAAILDEGTIETALYVVKAPRLLTIVPTDVVAHHIPLQVAFKDPSGTVGTYRLLAAAYGLPMIKADKGFAGNHAIAIVRYGDKWYECDNHTVTAFTQEADIAQWIDEAARTSYHGLGMSAGAVPAKHPMMAIYELV